MKKKNNEEEAVCAISKIIQLGNHKQRAKKEATKK